MNLTGEAKRVLVCLDGDAKRKARAVCLKGPCLGEENSLEEQDRDCALFGACKWINYKVGGLHKGYFGGNAKRLRR